MDTYTHAYIHQYFEYCLYLHTSNYVSKYEFGLIVHIYFSIYPSITLYFFPKVSQLVLYVKYYL